MPVGTLRGAHGRGVKSQRRGFRLEANLRPCRAGAQRCQAGGVGPGFAEPRGARRRRASARCSRRRASPAARRLTPPHGVRSRWWSADGQPSGDGSVPARRARCSPPGPLRGRHRPGPTGCSVVRAWTISAASSCLPVGRGIRSAAARHAFASSAIRRAFAVVGADVVVGAVEGWPSRLELSTIQRRPSSSSRRYTRAVCSM